MISLPEALEPLPGGASDGLGEPGRLPVHAEHQRTQDDGHDRDGEHDLHQGESGGCVALEGARAHIPTT